jgi:putative ATPase
VGLADPTALPLAVAAFQGSQLIGKPECDVLLAQATVHLGKSFST